MSECIINNATAKEAIITRVKEELAKTGAFTFDGFIAKANEDVDYKPLIANINRAFGEDVIVGSKGEYYIIPSRELAHKYFMKTPEGQEMAKIASLFSPEGFPESSPNHGEMFAFLNVPEVSEVTYDKLIDFLKKINPKFNVKLVDNLSVDGFTQLKDFLISVNTLSKFKALPEEVAHVVVELLPEDSQLKKDLIENVTSFPIYGLTYEKYKTVYTIDGNPDISKIKREAAAKLLSEYIYAISTNDKSRLDQLTKPKQGFLRKWFAKLLAFFGMKMTENTDIYWDVANDILDGTFDHSFKSEREVADLGFSDSYFFKLSREELYFNATEIMNASPSKLFETVTKFHKEFASKFNEILKSEKFKELDEELKRNPTTGNIGKINRLTDIANDLAEARVSFKDIVDGNNLVQGIKQFLEAVDNMEMLAKAIYKVINDKSKAQTFDEAIKNINELQSYASIYRSFLQIVDTDIAEMLRDVKNPDGEPIGLDVLASIGNTKTIFNEVNTAIVNKLQDDVFIVYKTLMSKANQGALESLEAELAIAKSQPNPSDKIIKSINDRIKKLIQDDEAITRVLSGTGPDINVLSNLGHLLAASITNGDLYISSIAKFINDRIEVQQSKAQSVGQSIYDQIDKIQKELKETAEVTGKKITFVDKVYDPSTDSFREVLTWLNPHKDIYYDLEVKKRAAWEAARLFSEADKNSPEWEELNKGRIKANQEYNEFLRKYFNRPYKQEYYDFKEKYEEDAVFTEAMAEYKALGYEITGQESILELEPWNEKAIKDIAMLRRRRSSLLSEHDELGKLKPETELKKVRILKQFFEESGKFKELDEVQTERSFLIARNRQEHKVDMAIHELKNAGISNIKEAEVELAKHLNDKKLRIQTEYTIKNEEDFLNLDLIKEILMGRWDKKNKLVQPNELFYEDEARIMEELQALKNKGELTPEEIQIKEAYDYVRKIKFGSRDVYGEVNPESLTDEQRNHIIELEDLIAELRAETPSAIIDVNDMTPQDRKIYDSANEILANPNATARQKVSANRNKFRIEKKYKKSEKSEALKELYILLGSLKNKYPTSYYWQSMERFLNPMAEMIHEYRKEGILEEGDLKKFEDFYKNFEAVVDMQDAEIMDFDMYTDGLFESVLDYMKSKPQYEEIYNWFIDNHRPKKVWDERVEKFTQLPYMRNSLYVYSVPTREEHQKHTYNKKFIKYKIKEEWKTPQVVGETISNRETGYGFAEFLPLTPEQGAPKDSPYRNEEYYRMKNSTDPQDKLRFQYLELLKKSHLEHQEKVPARLRSWMQAPVMELSNFEEKARAKETAKGAVDWVKSIFNKSKAGDAQAQLQGEDTIEEVDQITQEIITDRIPKLGMAQKIPIERVSRDVLKGTLMYVFRSHEFEARLEQQPIVEAVITVMKSKEVHGAKGNKDRLKKIEAIFSQKILEEVPDTVFNKKGMRRIAKILTTATSLRLVADPVGGAINFIGATVNNVIESFAFKYINPIEYMKGNILAGRMNMHLMADVNKKSNFSLDTMLFLEMDMLQGEFEEDLLDRSSSKDKWSSIRQILMLPRKAGELMAQTAMAMGMMERHKVKNSIDGKKYPMHEIYKKEGNKMVLKEGFPEEYAPGGEAFEKMKKLIHRVNLELHGNYAKINQTEASRYALGKLGENMKRWFMPAIIRRFGRETVDVTYEDLNEGYYRTAASAAFNIFKNLFTLQFAEAKSWAYIYAKTPKHRQNLGRAGADIGIATLLWFMFANLLGYSGDDKNKNLKEDSWAHQVALLIMLRSYSEATAFIPVPPWGFQEMKRNILTPFSLPADTVSNLAAIGQLGLYHVLYMFGADSFEKDLFYQRDAGYWYSEKGDSKFVKYLLRTLGHNGYTFNPDQYIKDFSNLQSRLK